MIQTGFESRIKVQDIVQNQLPSFILDENPKTEDFLKQYYISQEYQGGPIDIAENLDQYLKLDNLKPEVIVDNTLLESSISESDTTISASSTKGFPESYGLLKIDDEIITYTGITTNSFVGCIRGFSGITAYHQDLNQNELVFSKSSATSHTSNSSIKNLSSLFLKEFYKKFKYSFASGFEDKKIYENVNAGNFLKEIKSLYSTKGTDESFKILFKALFGQTPEIINLEKYLLKPSDAEFLRREVLVVEAISGNPLNLLGQSIFKSTDKTTQASVSSVENFTRKGKTYYKLSLFVGYGDKSNIQGLFDITQSTKCLEETLAGSTVLSVDSTIGFPQSGTIYSGNNTISYSNKSVNQFLGCSGIESTISSTDDVRSNETYYGYENGDISKKVEFRTTGVLSKFVPKSESIFVEEGQILSIKSLGERVINRETNNNYKETFANSWIYNTSSTVEIDSFTNGGVILKSAVDKSQFKVGDKVEIIDSYSGEIKYPTQSDDIPYISSFDKSSLLLSLNNFNNFISESSGFYSIRRKINKASSDLVSIEYGNNKIISDVQNVYFDEDNFAYVASNSLPSSKDFENIPYVYNLSASLNSSSINENSGQLADVDEEYSLTSETKVYTSIQFDQKVNFVTGDSIYYEPENSSIAGLTTGTYYVEVIKTSDPSTNKRKIKLYGSRSFIGDNTNSIRLSFPNGIDGNHNFTLSSQKSKSILSNKKFKKFKLEQNLNDGTKEKTVPGSIGMLINGVEIDNWKVNDKVYYGNLVRAEILNGGDEFDVINPPKLEVSSGAGITALVQPVVKGSVKEILIDEKDLIVEKVLSINVSGGNGTGGIFKPIVSRKRIEVLFDARTTTNGGGISTTTSQLTFLTNHNFVNGQEIIYKNSGQPSVTIGAGTSSLIDNKLYYVRVDNNTTIKLYENLDDYNSNNFITFEPTWEEGGIQKFAFNEINNILTDIQIIDGGEFTNRKLIVKSSGISTTENTINFENHGFSTGELIEYSSDYPISGIQTTNQYYVVKETDNSFKLCDAGVGGTNTTNFNSRVFSVFSSQGTGYQTFKYPDITANIEYTTVGIATTTQSRSITLTPIVTGKIDYLYLYEKGTKYGSTILNLHKKPDVSIKVGKDAQVSPIIQNGFLGEVNLQFGGEEYFSTPDLEVFDPTGSGSGAKLRPVVSNGSITDVKVIRTGIGYSTSTVVNVLPRGINFVEKVVVDTEVRSLTVNNVNKTDSKQYEILRDDDKLQYSVSAYFDTLRSSFEDDGSTTSRIIGWAYDGNPIYGSYGSLNPQNISSGIKTMTSGYTLDVSNVEDRPSDFDPGFFIEDYQYTGTGDLDEHNGRYAKTNEFPNGIYAYYATIDPVTSVPAFPYFIGQSFRSKTIEENDTLNQNFDFNESSLLRNTFPYKISELNSGNDFIIETNEILTQEIVVESIQEGSIDNIDILSRGLNYKVGEKLNFDNTGTGGSDIEAEISSIQGGNIENITSVISEYSDSPLIWENENTIRVYTNSSNEINNNDYVIISGLSTSIKSLSGSYKVSVPSEVSVGITTDIIGSGSESTEIYLSNIPSNVSIGDSIRIGSETAEVLNVYPTKNILTIKRGSPSTLHTVGTAVTFNNNYFDIKKKTNQFESELKRKIYFNPNESVGVGTTAGTGTTVSFNFGQESISRFLLVQRLYLENHQLETNQIVTFSANGNNAISISTTPTSTQFDLPTSVYVVNKSPNTIGIKTTLTGNEVFFRSNGDNVDDYYFETSPTQKTVDVKIIKSTVAISSAHGLSFGDEVKLNVRPNLSVGIGTSTAVRVIRNQNTNNIEINPVGFTSLGINTTTNEITLENHSLNSGDKVYYDSTEVASGLTTGGYFVSVVDQNKIHLSNSYLNSIKDDPIIVSIAGTGGNSHTLSLINPKLPSVRNNNLVFDLSDSSLNGYNFKLYYDSEFNNEFVSTGTTSVFAAIGVGTIGVSTNASVTINYSKNLPERLYYNLEKSGYISTSDKEVKNYNEILFVNSSFNNSYSISGIGTTTFQITLRNDGEKTAYTESECDILDYTTTSLSATGPVNTVSIKSFGSRYKKLPIFTKATTDSGNGLFVTANSKTIGSVKSTRIINEGFEYSSDKTLLPKASISPKVTLKNSNQVGIVTVTSGGRGFLSSPNIVAVDKITRNVIQNGLIIPVMNGGTISNILIEDSPKGLTDNSVELFTVNNTNGISIKSVNSISPTEFVCVLTTPQPLGFTTDPFAIGDFVFLEGIQKYGTEGTGFNSSDYGYKLFKITNYDSTSLTDDQLTVNVAGLTTNTGIAKTIQDSTGIAIHKDNYPTFDVTIIPSFFKVGEQLTVNNIDRNIIVRQHTNDTDFKVDASYDLIPGEVIRGKNSGVLATIESVVNYDAQFETSYSIERNEGWNSDVGFLSEDYQVLPDNDYYQNLSYSIKSPQLWKDIKTPVNNLVHSVGMKNFADSTLESLTGTANTITAFTDIDITLDLDEVLRVDTINNYDYTRDVDVVDNVSRFLEFKNERFIAYGESRTNVVLKIDDLSDQFSQFESNPVQYLDIFEIDSNELYKDYIFKVRNLENDKVQLTTLKLASNFNGNFIHEKESLSNKEDLSLHGDFDLVTNEFGETFLRFVPENPFDDDFDIKYIERKFTLGVGIATTSIGSVDVTSYSGIVTTGTGGITSPILSTDSNTYNSFYVSAQIETGTTSEMNFAEVYLTHDGTNGYIAENYFDSSKNNITTSGIGTFGVDLDSGLFKLNYTNNHPENVLINARILQFKSVGVGGTYRFALSGQPAGNERSAVYQTNYVTATDTTLPIEIFTLDKNNFDAVSSTIQIEVTGSTDTTYNGSAVYGVSFVHDITDSFTQTRHALFGTDDIAGIGTFGAELVGNDFTINFYPFRTGSGTGTIKITSLSEAFYTDTDFINEPPDLTFGTGVESFKTAAYLAIDGERINKRNFVLRSEGTPIFAKTFDPSDSTKVNLSTGVFSIQDHFFSNGEELVYTPKSTFVGVGSTPMMYKNGSVEDVLPSTVFAIVNNQDFDTFQISTTRSGTAVTFTSVGEGNAHVFAMAKRNEKAIITIDNMVQYPIAFNGVVHSLSGNGGSISTESTLFALSGIQSVTPYNILKIDDEYMNVINVGLGTTNVGPITGIGTETLVQVERGFVGSSATAHNDSSQVNIYRGNYNIVDDEIHFVKAPRGNVSITRTGSNLEFETSDFLGRVFLRKNYDTSQVFDDLSNNFTGIGNTYTLTVGGANTTGIGTSGGNGIVFINGIFQTPTTENNPSNNFRIIEGVGISSILFAGIRDNANTQVISEFDVNQNQLPRGGIIVSYGSSGGLGYAPLVGASVTAVVSGGVIQNSIGIGTTDNVGSGYNGLVSIGVSVYEENHSGDVASITATVGAGGTLTFNVTNGGTGYNNPQIFVSPPSYENLEVVGVSRVGFGSTTDTGVGLLVDIEIGAASTTGIGSTTFEVKGFRVKRPGYSFRKGDKFTPVGLVTAKGLSEPFSQFVLEATETYSDNFAAWQFGELDFIDSIKNYQDGSRVRFPLYYNSSLKSFEKQVGSRVNLQNALIVIINGIIQDPGVNYIFDGGTAVTFTEAPKPGDDVAIFFYRGTRGEDDFQLDNIIPSIERGDLLDVNRNPLVVGSISQNQRTVIDLPTSDVVETAAYREQGIESIYKPTSWTKKKSDKFINGEFIFKTRDSIKSQTYPTAKIIKDISTTDTKIFVDNAEFFTSGGSIPDFEFVIVDQSQNNISAEFTVSVGTGGTISDIEITNPGYGYTGSTVNLRFSPPILENNNWPTVSTGIGTTATATATVGSGGTLTSVTITNPGYGYTGSVFVIADHHEVKFENTGSNSLLSVKGFSGIVTGIGTTDNSGQLALEFYLDRETLAFNNSGDAPIATYPILIYDTQIGSGVTSVDNSDSAVVGIGTTFLDNIYYINQITYDGTVGIATCNIDSGTDITGLSTSGDFVGRFSWGLFDGVSRSSSPISIGVTGKTVNSGLSTFPFIQRRKYGLRDTGAIL